MTSAKTMMMVLAAMICSLAFMQCGDSDSDNDAGMTKQELCLKVADGYYEKQKSLSCASADADYSESKTVCRGLFDGTCEVSTTWSEQANHAIEKWIDPQTSCEGIDSLDSSLEGLITDMQAASCETDDGNNQNSTKKSVGEWCENLLDVTCSKIQALECASLTLSECATNLLASGLLTFDGTTCTTVSDTTPASTAFASEVGIAIAGVQNVSSCTELGF